MSALPMLFLQFALVSSAFAVMKPVQVAECKNPNGTDTKEAWWTCLQNGPIITKSVQLLNETGSYQYPIHINQKLIIRKQISNSGGKAFKSLRADVSLWRWGGWLGCTWHDIPTFTLLDNMDPCLKGSDCPIPTGDSVIDTVVDFSQYSTIISFLTDHVPYKLRILTKDHTEGDKPIDCITFEAIALKK